MKKVIKKGKLPVKKFECSLCETIWESDQYKVTNGSLLGGGFTVSSLYPFEVSKLEDCCPICKKKNEVIK